MILLHPCMRAVQIEEFAIAHDMVIEIDSRPHRLVLTAVPRVPHAFTCTECHWEGDHPETLDFDALGLPSVADIPICPRCESLVYRLPVLKGASHG